MDNVHVFKTIPDYNDFVGARTLHPLVNVINMAELGRMQHMLHRFGFYACYLKEHLCGPLYYGRSQYDYREGTLVFIGPNQVSGVNDGKYTENPKGWILLFHPDLLLGTPLAKKMKEYTFFSYSSNEALHMSDREHETISACLQSIRDELSETIDKHTKSIVVSSIEVFLNHCVRFYDRQFVTRENINHDVISRFNDILDEYFSSGNTKQNGLPSVKWCADEVHLSSNYFGDLIKKEIGMSAQEYIQNNIVERAKDLLFERGLTVSEIAYRLGFNYPQHLSRMFKKVTGVTPNEFRLAN